jgi:RNA-directed DNA polymerase
VLSRRVAERGIQSERSRAAAKTRAAREKMDTEDHEGLLELMLWADNLHQAWRAVKANDGAAGVDGKDIAQTRQHLKQHWPGIARQIRRGSYRPGAIREVQIAKPDGGQRTLGIPNVQDRLIQQALLQILQERFDGHMSAHSYGYRPGRNAHQAIQAAQAFVRQGKRWVVDIDLKDFFNQIDHDILMREVGRQVIDPRLRKLIALFLRAPTRDAQGQQRKRRKGVPQGAPMSPLLSNVYLDLLDQELERRAVAFVRYADDIAIFAGSQQAAERIYESVVQWLRKHLKLEVNPAKSGVGPTDDSTLLGYRIRSDGNLHIAPKAEQRYKQRVREHWNARRSISGQEHRQQWQQFIRGWSNYFSLVTSKTALELLSGWTRRHMRKFMWQRWHNRAGRRNALTRLGLRGRILGMASSRIGAWALSAQAVLQRALPNARLAAWGLLTPSDLVRPTRPC